MEKDKRRHLTLLASFGSTCFSRVRCDGNSVPYNFVKHVLYVIGLYVWMKYSSLFFSCNLSRFGCCFLIKLTALFLKK